MRMRKTGPFVRALCSRVACAVRAIWPATSPLCPPGDVARIRLFGLKARPLVMVMPTAKGVRSFVKVDGARAADLSSALTAVQAQARRDWALTAGSRDPKPGRRIFSKACYWEFLVPGGKPLQIVSASGASLSPIAFARAPWRFPPCDRSSDAVSFTPQGAKDYQVDIYTNDGVCTVTVHEVKTSASETQLVPIALD